MPYDFGAQIDCFALADIVAIGDVHFDGETEIVPRLLGLVSREVFLRWRDRMLATGRTGKFALGGMLVAIGGLVMSGLDNRLETFLIDVSPAWLTALTTSI